MATIYPLQKKYFAFFGGIKDITLWHRINIILRQKSVTHFPFLRCIVKGNSKRSPSWPPLLYMRYSEVYLTGFHKVLSGVPERQKCLKATDYFGCPQICMYELLNRLPSFDANHSVTGGTQPIDRCSNWDASWFCSLVSCHNSPLPADVSG